MTLPPDLLVLKELIFDPLGYAYTPAIMEKESAAYAACAFEINGQSARFRTAKITPTKTGQFVTLWKRTSAGPIAPYEAVDDIDLVLVCTRKNDRYGHFVFPKSALCKYGILTSNGREGKRAIRVYPPWDKVTNKQAQKSQEWQLAFFLEVLPGQVADQAFANRLYGVKNEALL